jgi:hypothetical protein
MPGAMRPDGKTQCSFLDWLGFCCGSLMILPNFNHQAFNQAGIVWEEPVQSGGSRID